MKRRRKIVCCACMLLCLYTIKAQELNAKITINSDKISRSDKQIFTTLQNALTEFVNNRKWSDAAFSINERIDCTMTVIVNEINEDNFKCELQIQARRPVYNASYTTTILNVRDRQLEFNYTEFEPLEHLENTLNNNLTATVIFYVYTILGLDFDSYALKGGTSFLQQAQQVVSLAQSQPGWSGWKAFDSDRNRHAIITALTDNASEPFRTMWYAYHRKGLDEMAANPDRGRTTIIETVPALEEIKKLRPMSVLLQLYSDAKLEELVAIYSNANTQERQQGYKTLSQLYPTESTRLEALKK